MSEPLTLADIKYDEVTPLMQQYLEVKKDYMDCIVFYRLGDFYEMFFDDALTASRELEITLTGRNCGLPERAPMCGIPYHAYEGYLTRLVEKGYSVAVCEQLEDPALAKGLVKRDVTRIVTPGTNINPQALDETRNNFLMSIVYSSEDTGIAVADVSTGDFFLTECSEPSKVLDEIAKYSPSELICNNSFAISGIDIQAVASKNSISLKVLNDEYYDQTELNSKLLEHFKADDFEQLGLASYDSGITAAGSLLKYLFETQKNSLDHLIHITPYVKGKYMILDNATRRNLELTETMREKNKRGSLLWVLDKAKTAMGARLLRSFIEQPLLREEDIIARLDAVAELREQYISREEIREYLNTVYDLERLSGRISYRNANPRDLTAFASSLAMLPAVRMLADEFSSELLKKAAESLDTLQDLYQLISESITEEPPINIKEGGIFKPGFNAEIDRLRGAKTEGKTWLTKLEEEERSKTGIKTLRIKYSRVFGYCLEVSNSYKELVPDNWTRKQTLTGGERYTTPELKELEDTILNAEDRLFSLEYDLFCEIREHIASNIERIQKTAKAIASLDAFASLAYVSERNNYVRPNINTKGTIDIKGGRHPVIEQFIGHDSFIANDTYLDNDLNRIAIITGPNMAGKSTYMRQTALIVLMAQCGSFVPADEANIGIVDRVFTRVGASDDLASGQSTFMVEMNEVASILKNATSDSLLILDEIGRGTSTFDGLSIAWAVIEHINNKKVLGAKTLFATHYHELTELEDKLQSVKNFCIAVKEQGDDIIFLRKIIRGGADKSYGIQVARLAGLPNEILSRAHEIVDILTDNDINNKIRETAGIIASGSKATGRKKNDYEGQMNLFDVPDYSDVIAKIRDMDIQSLTPLEALNRLNLLQDEIKQIM